jgi:DNA-binding CsgD family transcriptional regulator
MWIANSSLLTMANGQGPGTSDRHGADTVRVSDGDRQGVRVARRGRPGTGRTAAGATPTVALPAATASPELPQVTAETVAHFLYDLHLRAHTLPQDSFRRWLTAALESLLGADAACLFDAVGLQGAGGAAVALAWAEVDAVRSMGTMPADGVHVRPQMLVALLPEQASGRTEGPWLVLQRRTGDFGPEVLARLRLLRLHLGLGLALNRWEQRVRQNGPTSRLGRAHGVSDRRGRLLQADPEFLTLLRREWADAREQLPQPLLALLRPEGGRRVGVALVVDCVPIHGDSWLWVLRPRHDVDTLSERQRLVARMFADGRNYKEIAAALQLAPATIRRHIQTAYARLGVRRKIELAQLLADSEQPGG